MSPGPSHAAVRPARAEEAEQVVLLYEWLFAPPGSQPAAWDPERATATLRALPADPRAEVLLAEASGELVGLCTVYLDIASVRFGQRAWVEDLAVHPEHRSARIGKALVDTAKAWARERGATHLELDSGPTRADAHRFYHREGPSWTSTSFAWAL